ncbi:hypothetical protein H4R19_003289 [Coemansia spiralis]|nr:hypothetical protein H4R19_003289 [Coemansia spiralis]
MRLGQTAIALAAGLSVALGTPVDDVRGPKLFRRNGTEDLQAFKGALLLKNGQQTSCEIALMYTTVGFVAANCLDFNDSGAKTVNTTTRYEVMISQGLTAAYGRFPATMITVNPNYDPESFANNIAVIQFANSGNGDFVNYIASWRPEWSSLYFVRRSLNNMAGTAWNPPTLTQYSGNADAVACANANPLFKLNEADLLCNQLTTSSPVDSSCTLPFGSVYGVNNPNAAVAALYSHSAVYGKDTVCKAGRIFNYYIVMQNYVHWAMSVIGVKAPVFHARLPEYTETLDPNYSMKIPNPKSVDGVTVHGGDLYHEHTGAPAAATSSEAGGLSKGAIVGIVLALLALLALLGFLLRKYLLRKYKNTRVRRWWFWGRHNKDDEPVDVAAQRPDPNDPQRPSTYPNNQLPSYHDDRDLPLSASAYPPDNKGPAGRHDEDHSGHASGSGGYPIQF